MAVTCSVLRAPKSRPVQGYAPDSPEYMAILEQVKRCNEELDKELLILRYKEAQSWARAHDYIIR